MCRELDHNAHLTPIASTRSNSHVQNLARSTWGDIPRLWIGAERVTTSNSDYFQWTTRDPFSFQYWADGEPNNWHDRGEDCVAMQVPNGRWNDDVCTEQYNFICYKRAYTENCKAV